MYEVFEHTADLGLRIRAADLHRLFADAAQGLFSVIAGDLSQVRLAQTVRLQIGGNDLEYLLFDWLNELLFRFESQRLLLAEFRVQVSGGGLTAEARGEPLDLGRHQLEHEVKAITYHGLRIARQDEMWQAEVILDI